MTGMVLPLMLIFGALAAVFARCVFLPGGLLIRVVCGVTSFVYAALVAIGALLLLGIVW